MRPAIEGDIICRECATRYAAMLQTARSRTTNVQRSLNTLTEQQVLNVPAQELREGTSTVQIPKTQPLVDLEPSATVGKPRRVTQLVGFVLLSIGLVALIASVMLTSTILSFVGLGLAFWGMLAFFIQPQKHVKSFLMDTTALSSLKTIDRMMMATGYREKGVYVPTEKEKAVVFVPLVPRARIPAEIKAIEDRTFSDDPLGMVVVPPGLALANLIEKNLGFTLRNCGVETVLQVLPKVLAEDLEVVRNVDIEVRGSKIDFKLVDSIYYDFCRKIRNTSKRCGLGCPMCSALACIIASASGKPVLLNEDELNTEKGTTLSSYEILNRPRL